jgi:osmotically-inducible protein OsmY
MKTGRQLEHDVEENLDGKPEVNATNIGVEFKEGVVTLLGDTSSFPE